MEFVKVMYSLDFSHPSLGVYSFATPPIKLKLGQQIGGGLLPNSKPPGPRHDCSMLCHFLQGFLLKSAFEEITQDLSVVTIGTSRNWIKKVSGCSEHAQLFS
jgi:hypothetical protein